MSAKLITLDAALRDSREPQIGVRDLAIRQLAPALLDHLGLQGPVWAMENSSSQAAEVIAVLRTAMMEDGSASIRGHAAVGLGLLGDASVFPWLSPWVEHEGDDEASAFLRQCAVIAISLLAQSSRDKAIDFHLQAVAVLRDVLSSSYPDVRFQAAEVLITAVGDKAEGDLSEAFATEKHSEVRRALAEAFTMIEHPSPVLCNMLSQLLADPQEDRGVSFAAALTLAAAKDERGGLRLVAALEEDETCDRALEALAVLGARAPTVALESIYRMCRKGWLPTITRVRAAYALARIQPKAGKYFLHQLTRSWRKSVREAAHEALALLERGE